MTVGELKKFLERVKDDSLPVTVLSDGASVKDDYMIGGALLISDSAGANESYKGVYLMEE